MYVRIQMISYNLTKTLTNLVKHDGGLDILKVQRKVGTVVNYNPLISKKR